MAGSHVATVVFDIVADSSKLKKSFSDVEKKSKKIGDSIGKKFGDAFKKSSKESTRSSSKIVKNLQRVGKAAAVVATTVAYTTSKLWLGLKKLGSGLASAFGKLGNILKKSLLAATAAATLALGKLLKDTISYGDEVDKNSQKMGISAEGYQKWGYILDRCGASMDSMKPAMKKLATAAQTNNAAFAKLGITQEELASLNQEQLFERTVGALQKVENQTERTYLASQLLGRGGTELGAVFNLTDAETQQLVQRLDYLGGSMSGAAVSNCAQFCDVITDLKMAFRGVGNVLAEYVLPIITSVVNNAIIPAVVRLRQALDGLFSKIPLFKKIKESFNKKTADNANKVASGVSNINTGLSNTGKSAKKAKKNVQALKRELLGFDKITKLSGESGTDTDTGTTGSSGVDAGGGGIDDLEDEVENALKPKEVVENWWKEFKTAFNAIDWSALGTKFGNWINDINEKIANWKLGTKLANLWNDGIDFLYSAITTTKFDKIGETIGNFINDVFLKIDWAKTGKTVSEAIHGIFETINTAFTTVKWDDIAHKLSDFVKNLDFKQLGKDLGDFVKNAINSISTLIAEFDWKELGKKILEFLTGIDWLGIIVAIFKLLVSLMKAQIGLLEGAWGFIWDKLTDALGKVKDKIGEKVGEIKDKIVEKFQNAKEGAEKKVTELKDKVVSKFNEAKDKAGEKIVELKKKWDNSDFKEKVANVKAQIATKAAELREKWNNLTKNVKDYTAHVKADVATKWANLRDKWNNLMAHFKDKKASISLDIAAKMQNLKKWINTNIIDRVNNVIPQSLKKIGLKIPRLAQGGYVKANTPQLAMIGDNKRQGEIVAPESKLAAMAAQAAGSGNDETNTLLRQLIAVVSTLNLNVELDGEQIKNNTVRRINNHTKATGKLELLI